MPPDLTVEYLDPALLKRRSRNPRTHSKKQIKQIAESIKEFGFLNPVLIGPNQEIIAGHGRVEGAKRAGLERVPVVSVDHLSADQVRAYVIADNKLTENAGWDYALLELELRELDDAAFDVSLLGFEGAEIDAFFQREDKAANEDQFVVAESSQPPVSRLGDLWLVGPHRILCGDATQSAHFDLLMEGEKAQCVFTDPPFNVPINGHVSGLGRIRHREFAAASGEMSKGAFTEFLGSAIRNLVQHSADGSIHYVCMDWRHIGELLAAATPAYTELKNLCVWAKSNGGMGSLYRSRHELVFVFKNGTAPHTNNVELGKNGRNRTNVWEYPGVNSFGPERQAELAMHPTVKPVAMVADALLDCSTRNGLVLDPFAGSGTTLMAAHKTGRRAYGLEIDGLYVDAVIRRLKSVYDLDARLAADGSTFEQAGRARLGDASEAS